jgi:hypothetical protein
MAFPSVIVECAFNNILAETSSAATGFTDITKYVERVSGTLRGRVYELDEIETGSINVTLDNSDGRFTPGSPLSPYYPYVKANRRFRIRGKNMQRQNIARAGGQDMSTNGFFRDANFVKDATDGVTYVVTDPVLVKHNPVSMGFDGALLDEPYHIEATFKAGATPGAYRVISYWCPVELGVRSTHSAYVWRVSGTEPSGTLIYLVNSYYDANGDEIEKAVGDSNLEWSEPTEDYPVRRVFSDLPPGDAAYMIQSVAVITTATTTEDVTYAINGIQSEIPLANLVPSISGYYDVAAWQTNATGDTDPGTVEQAGADWSTTYVLATMGSETVEVYTTVPHLVPGDYYTFAVEVQKSGGPDVWLSGDDGQSGAVLSANNVWTTLRHTFLATKPEQEVKLILQGSPAVGSTLSIRLAKCAAQNDNLPLASGATDTDETEWERPIPVFEGWVERWPITTTAFASTISITVNDRLKKLGDITMESTLKQTMLTDGPALLMPMTDHPGDSNGVVSILGDWADDADLSQVEPSQTKYGAGAATFTLGGLVGPTDDDAVKFIQVSSTQGYVLLLPYTYDYTTTPAAPSIKPPPVPPPLSKTYLRRKYYATWSQNYQGTNARRTSAPGPYVYQGISGFVTESYGNQKALIGFNWSAIKSDLKDYTVKNTKTKQTTTMHVTPVGVTVSLLAVDWGLYTSGTGYVGWHKYGSAPTTYDSAQVAERLVKSTKWPRNAWRTISLGATVAKYFQAGTARGVVVGYGDSTKETYGTWYGATAGKYRPYLTVTYKVTPVKKKK